MDQNGVRQQISVTGCGLDWDLGSKSQWQDVGQTGAGAQKPGRVRVQAPSAFGIVFLN